MATALTAASVKRLKVRPGERPELPDGGCPGLYLVLHASGRKVYAFRYRRPTTGKPAKLTLGVADTSGREEVEAPKVGGLLTLAAARQLATEARRRVALGKDPAAERVEEKAGVRERRKDTFPAAARTFINRYAKPKNKHWRDTAATLGLVLDPKTDAFTDEVRGLAKRWRDTPMSSLAKAEVLAVIDGYADRGKRYMANGVHATLRKFFKWHVERGTITTSPLSGVGQPHTPVARDRELTDEEIFCFWRAAGRMGEPFGPLFRLLLVTGQRRDELRRLNNSELVDNSIVLPPARTKNKKEHVVPLTRLAQEILEGITRVGDELVFSTTGRTPISGLSKAKAQLDREMLVTLRALARRAGRDPAKAKLKPWRLHDLRRTLATRMGEADIPDQVIERVLNHTRKTVTGRHYDHSKRLAAVRSALEWWESELLRLAEGAA